MRHRRSDIVERAIEVLDAYGLADLSMRRIAGELGLQPSALYHHFDSKQVLLAAVADELLDRGSRPDVDQPWDETVLRLSDELRDAMLAYRDGAELVATVYAFGLGARTPHARLASAVGEAGFDEPFASDVAATILHFVFGHVSDEQTHLQANSVGAIDSSLDHGGTASFALGLALILDGVSLRVPVRSEPIHH